MAAYAALVSLRHIIEQLQHHPRPPISLHKLQVESLTERVTFLQDFLENYSCVDALEGRIADAAYAAEDIIESHIVDQIQAGSTSTHVENISGSTEFYQDLQEVIQDMDLIERDVMEINKEKTGIQDQLQRISMCASSSRSPPMGQNMTMVGFDDVLIEIMDKLTGQQSNRQIIPIVGMGGIGKTALASTIYMNPLIVQYFDILVWVTISQEYSVREILVESLLCQKNKWSKDDLSGMSEHKLGELLHKSLSGRRYLIVMDDLWSVDAWDRIKFFFPDNNNGSRIVITTRLSNVAVYMTDSCDVLKMKFLDEDNSWNLFCKSAFGEEGCPLELEEMGKKIAKYCKGLPLSITVIGGLLSKYKQSREYWKHIVENLNPILNSEDNEHCLKILRMSYRELPVHLKPCFLYTRVFPEDYEIRVSWLIRLWVAEGFLKPISGKSLEVVAEEYLKDLVDRNLILVHKWGHSGKIVFCKIHDLLRDLCLRESQKDKFLCFTRPHSLDIPHDIQSQRRISIHHSTSPQVVGALQSASLARSLICEFRSRPKVLPSLNHRLLRVLMAADNDFICGNYYCMETIFQLVNSRFLAVEVDFKQDLRVPSSICHLWNLQTLVVNGYGHFTAPSEIWKMPQLRHVSFSSVDLPDPPIGDTMDGLDDFVVLGNLQTLQSLRNFKFSEEVVKRIPNIKKLKIKYAHNGEESSPPAYCLDNLGLLHKLESLCCSLDRTYEAGLAKMMENLIFPRSLKKLTLTRTYLHWEDMKTKIGSLPNLQVLKLKFRSCEGPVLETVEGQFCSLKFLLIESCGYLEYWRTESSTHFPRLEHLVLRYLHDLKEIPSTIGDISTLQSIVLEYCSNSAIISAKEILKEQEDLGNVGLHVRVRLRRKNEVVESLASPNFQVETVGYSTF
ncbi:hypothetical protein DH2020_041221 [Rehmannia glutinosa]|uniref:NB-ARC domain-containing protein n=1 Tax=Rehmannia glutinosa TaxID=99300 RepID=A0ABR0US09_REHGL